MTIQELEDAIRGLVDQIKTRRDEMGTILDGAKDGEGKVRALADDEKTRFDAADADMATLVERKAQLETQLSAERAAVEDAKRYGVGTGGARVTDAPVYTPTSGANGGPSYFRDLWLATRNANRDAIDRLTRNDRAVADQLTRAGLTTVNGAGGEWVPPLWLEEQFVKYVRPGRKTADLCTKDMLPAGTDSINLPKMSGGTAVAFQGTQNTAINETDLTTTSISAGVYTVAGGQTIAIQLVEQSPLNIDQVVLKDLAADYARFLDSSVVLNGSGTGQPTGLLNLAGTTAVAFTSTTPTVGGTGANALYPKIANAIQAIESSRYDVPTHIVMHPRRWGWILSASDSNSRPLVVPSGNNFNPVGTSGALAAEGVVGEIMGLPVVTDANIPTNLGAGTNQDPIIVGKFDDAWLWEGRIRAEVFPQTYAQNASLYARLYNYVAFQPGRYPVSFAVINGTGLTAPTF